MLNYPTPHIPNSTTPFALSGFTRLYSQTPGARTLQNQDKLVELTVKISRADVEKLTYG